LHLFVSFWVSCIYTMSKHVIPIIKSVNIFFYFTDWPNKRIQAMVSLLKKLVFIKKIQKKFFFFNWMISIHHSQSIEMVCDKNKALSYDFILNHLVLLISWFECKLMESLNKLKKSKYRYHFNLFHIFFSLNSIGVSKLLSSSILHLSNISGEWWRWISKLKKIKACESHPSLGRKTSKLIKNY